MAVIESLKPTAIIGVSTKGKAFDQKVVEAMARAQPAADHLCLLEPDGSRGMHRRRRPTAGPRGGRCTRPACRSRRCAYGGKTLVPGQGNNLYIFPAVGLAIYATKAGA